MDEGDTERSETDLGTVIQAAQTEKSKPERLEVTLENFDKAAGIGRGILHSARERERQRLTPYLDARKFPEELIARVGQKSKEEPVTLEDIQNAKKASLGIAVEAATQIAEVQLPRGSGVSEDLESLDGLGLLIQQGSGLVEELSGKEPGLLREQVKEVIARRLGKKPEEIEKSDAELDSFLEEQFRISLERVGRASGALRAYWGK
jgi:hypothetical protein